MNKVILDSSALIAYIKNEPGAEIVEKLIGSVVMSSVSISEVAAILMDSEMSIEECKECILPFVDQIVNFGDREAFLAAELKKQTKHKGLRACILLGKATGYPVYTADKAWTEIELDCQIILIK